MIKYDWEKVQKICNFEPNDVVWYLAYKSGVYTKTLTYIVPVSKKLYTEAKRDPLPYGSSYILNPELLFSNTGQYSLKHIYEYVYLASLRGFFEWRVRGDCTLHATIAKAFDIDAIHNSLLTIENNIINFKYEQITTEVENGD